MEALVQRFPGARLGVNAVTALVIWGLLTWVNQFIEPLMSYYLATAAMYATAMFGMTILLGLSGQVSLGNGALMAIGGYIFALTSMNWQTVPILGTPWNAVWSMVFAGFGGVVFGAAIGGIAARLRGPYLAGLTLGIAVGVPAIANRFPELLGGENGLMLQVPYPAGGYTSDDTSDEAVDDGGEVPLGEEPVYEELPDDFGDFEEEFTDEFGDELDSDSGDLSDDDLLTEDDLLSEDDFLSDDDFLTDEDFTTEDGFEADIDSDAGADLDAGLDGGSEAGGGADITDPAADLDLAGVDAGVDAGFVIEQWQASMAIAVACVVGFIALNLVRGRQGRVWQAVRDDPIAAAVSGISPAGSKISAFVVSSLFAALAGAVFAQILTYVGPGAFTLGLSLSLLVGIVLGGRNSFIGAIIGAVILVWLPEFVLDVSADRGWQDQITNNAPNFIYGLLVVLVVLAAPGGIVGGIQSLAGRLRGQAKSSSSP
ncbi:MAG: branched-chain amino acid ABC transporter permease [Actinobacteria bacterium]|nr:branched-chain amino acid ABC transporter permease [Actinomycetota bacterium]